MNMKKTRGAAIRANIKYIEEGEKCTNYFLAMEKCRSKLNTIKKLKNDNGGSILNEREIVNTIGKHFFKRYNSSRKSDDEISTYFNDFSKNVVLPRLSPREAQLLEGDITEAELDAAVRSMERGSAPGRDGLPLEFYIVFWPRLKGPLMSCIKSCEEICKLTKSQRTGVLSLFHKGSELPTDCLDNWRPISLLNTDYKIIAKVFSRRLDTIINNLIGKQQTGFLKGRNIAFVHRQIDDMLTIHRQSKRAGILLAIDFKQAFDAINIPCILKSLELFGFGPRFINWIKILNTERIFSVKNGGHISQTFGMHNGVRQGCPISPQLFILAAEVLAQKIIQDKNIVGLKTNNNIMDVVLKILQYADDTSLFLNDLNSLRRAIEVFNSFSKCSDLHLNLRKSFAMSLNGTKMHSEVNIVFQDTIKILGIYYSNSKSAADMEINWRKRIDNVIRIFGRWSIRKMSIIGKLHVIKTFGLSQFTHIMQSISLPEHVLLEINQIFFKFLWNNKFSSQQRSSDRVKRSVITNNLEEGGLKMIDMVALQESIFLSWAEELLAPTNGPWRDIAITFFNSLGGKIVFKSKTSLKTFRYIHQVSSPFWKSVLATWLKYSGNQLNSYSHSYNDPLFNNSFIALNNRPLFFQNCINKNILKIKDVVNGGSVISFAEFVRKRGEGGASFLEYYAIANTVGPLLRRHTLTLDEAFEFQGTPVGKLGRKFFYEAINITDQPTMVDFWKRVYDIDVCVHHWQLIHSLRESRLRALAWKVAHNIYPTNASLFKMKLSHTPLCVECGVLDTMGHFFFHCRVVRPLWTHIQNKILADLNTRVNISETMVLLGPVHLRGVNIDVQQKIKHIITVGVLAISKLKYGCHRDLRRVFETEASLRNM